jgi:hypothetical protein
MPKNIFKSGKRIRPKTAVKGKRYLCAQCRKRSPRPVKTPAPWYCPNCLKAEETDDSGGSIIHDWKSMFAEDEQDTREAK